MTSVDIGVLQDAEHAAEQALRRLREIDEATRATVAGDRVEWYQRWSSTLSIERRGDGERVEHRGEDRGLAVRLADARERIGTASGTGVGERLGRALIDAARQGAAPSAQSLGSVEGERADLDPFGSDDDLASLIERWWAASPGGAAERRLSIVRSVECRRCGAAESVRTRERVVQSLRHETSGRHRAERGVQGVRILEEPPAGETVVPGPGPSLLPAPEAGHLVARLAAVLHGEGVSPGLEVGPGWRPLDDPGAADSVFGGVFDDVGDPVEAAELARDGRSLGGASARGRRRRASYRDSPAFTLAGLRIPSGPPKLPQEPPRLHAVRVEVLSGGRWCVIAGGRAVFDGSPLELVRRVVGTAGRAETSGSGVKTPGILLEL